MPDAIRKRTDAGSGRCSESGIFLISVSKRKKRKRSCQIDTDGKCPFQQKEYRSDQQ
jgi:hypothetical protein